MNLGYWGVKMPVTDTSNEPARALPVMDVGPSCIVTAGGAEKLSPTDSSAKTLTVPSGALFARLQVSGGSVWYTTDGTTPVIATNTGFRLQDLTIFEIHGPSLMTSLKILANTGLTPKVYVEYFKYERVIND
jgi:hypothetical protein